MPRIIPLHTGRGQFERRQPTLEGSRPQIHLRVGSQIRITPEFIAGLAILSLSLVNIFGPLGVLVFLAGSAAVIAMQPLKTLHDIVRFSPLLILPLLAIMSTIWSDAPQLSMRAGLELFVTFIATITICSASRPQTMVMALFMSSLILGLTFIPYIPASLATGTPLVAAMGSKNQVGFTGFLLFTLSLGVLSDRLQHWSVRWLSLVVLAPALLIIYLSQSGGTTSTVVLTLLVFPPLAILGRLNQAMRFVLIGLIIAVLIAGGLFANEIDAAVGAFRQSVLNKDATLTGRTYLWQVAERLAAIRPVWGYGYGAFWRHGNIDAEGLWRWGGIPNRSGFNFHNAFLEMRIDLGYVGYGVLIISCVGATIAALIRQVIRPSASMACLIATTLALFVRSFVEDGLIGSFGSATMIWLATGIYAFAPTIDPVRSSRSSVGFRTLRGQLTGPRRLAVPAVARKPLRDRGRSGQGTE